MGNGARVHGFFGHGGWMVEIDLSNATELKDSAAAR
ncbi:hypothetical protein CASFOL_000470 [Castilleja foliolosa]|uniref:Uncharacterized protein n=1 Tax=Castilleja foliolosa TaxID=1961234 RepID=A0ABD3ESS3_9LAMI